MALRCTCSGDKDIHLDFVIDGRPVHVCSQGVETGPGCGSAHSLNAKSGEFECHKGGTVYSTINDVVTDMRTQLASCTGSCTHIQPGAKLLTINGLVDGQATAAKAGKR